MFLKSTGMPNKFSTWKHFVYNGGAYKHMNYKNMDAAFVEWICIGGKENKNTSNKKCNKLKRIQNYIPSEDRLLRFRRVW